MKTLTKTVMTVFRLSEDYDSDESDIEDDFKWLTDKKQVRRKLKKVKADNLRVEGKLVKLVK